MAASECMEHIRHSELDFLKFSRLEALWLLEAATEFAAENIAAHETLITTHFVVRVPRINVNDFHYPIRVGARRGHVESDVDRASDRKFVFDRIALVRKDVRTRACKSL